MSEVPMNMENDEMERQREILGWSSPDFPPEGMTGAEIEYWVSQELMDNNDLDDDDLDLDDDENDDEARDPEDDPDAYGGREWLDLPDHSGYSSDDIIRGWFGEHPNDFNGEY